MNTEFSTRWTTPSVPRSCSRREVLFKHIPAGTTLAILAGGHQASLREKKLSTDFGVLFDIHGNIWADILYCPLAPRETFDLLKKINLVAQGLGNLDRLIINGSLNPTLEWVTRDLARRRANTMAVRISGKLPA